MRLTPRKLARGLRARARLPWRISPWLIPALLACANSVARAQDSSSVEPRWLRMNIPETHVGLEMEALKEDVSYNNAGSSTHELLSITPLAGARVQGSIYHPNLLSYDLNGEGGIGWATDTVKGPGYNVTRHEKNDLERYLAQVNFLAGKPYNASFFASQDHTYQNYDFFNTAVVDSQRYGGRVTWTVERFDLNADMGYRDDKASGLTGNSELADTYFHFNGINHRDLGSTTLSYLQDNYVNRFDTAPKESSQDQSVSLSDAETFGDRHQITAATGLNYSQYSYFNEQTETFNATENVTMNHRPNLDSFYNLNYLRSTQDPVSSSSVQGIAGLRHQLYDNLSSTLDAHGTYDESSGAGFSDHNDRYGLGLAENYTRHLNTWGRLSIGGAVIGDHEDHDADGGIVTTIDEPHQLFLPGSVGAHPVYLSNPRVIASSIEVRSGGVPALLNVDYQVIQTGELTELRLVPTSTLLHDGSSVLVTYQSESLYTASFESLNASAQIRLDLINTFGVYGRAAWLDNNAPPQALVETLTDWVGGADVTWRFARAGAEYEDFDSNFTRYQARRFFENFTFQAGAATTLGLNFNQIFYTYPHDGSETQYQFLALLNTQLTHWLWWNVEGGYFMDDAFGGQQDLAAARTALNFVWGKLTIRTGYQYNYQLTEATINQERRDRNFFYLYARRTF